MTMFQSGHGLAIKFLLEHYPRGSIGEENVVDDVRRRRENITMGAEHLILRSANVRYVLLYNTLIFRVHSSLTVPKITSL